MADQPPKPTVDQQLAAQADYLGRLSHKVDGLAAAELLRKVEARADSADSAKTDAKKDDAADDDARLAKMIGDAVRAAFRAQRDEATAAEREKEREERREGEPEETASDDDELFEPTPPVRSDSRADALRREQADENDRLEAQYALDQAFNAVEGTHAPKPISGQSARSYRTYCLKRLQKYSDDYKDIDLTKLPADAFKLADARIRADAVRVGSNPQELSRFIPTGNLLREVKRQDQTGRWISEFVGPVDAPNGMFAPFRMPSMKARFNMDLVKASYADMYRK
jgi:hypothetical protein